MSVLDDDPNTCRNVGNRGLTIMFLLALIVFGGIALYDWINP